MEDYIKEARAMLEKIWENNRDFLNQHGKKTIELTSPLSEFEKAKANANNVVLFLVLTANQNEKYRVLYNDSINDGIIIFETQMAVSQLEADEVFFKKYSGILLSSLYYIENTPLEKLC